MDQGYLKKKKKELELDSKIRREEDRYKINLG